MVGLLARLLCSVLRSGGSRQRWLFFSSFCRVVKVNFVRNLIGRKSHWNGIDRYIPCYSVVFSFVVRVNLPSATSSKNHSTINP